MGLEFPDDSDHLFPDGEGIFQTAVGIIKDLIFDETGDLSGCGGFAPAPFGQFIRGHLMMSGIAVGDGNEFDLMSGSGQKDGRAAEHQIGIIRMSPENQKAFFHKKISLLNLGLRGGIYPVLC